MATDGRHGGRRRRPNCRCTSNRPPGSGQLDALLPLPPTRPLASHSSTPMTAFRHDATLPFIVYLMHRPHVLSNPLSCTLCHFSVSKNQPTHRKQNPTLNNYPNHVLQSRNHQSHHGAQGPHRFLLHCHQEAHASQHGRQEVGQRCLLEGLEGRCCLW